MSCNYADGLSPYPDKGLLGLDEKFDSKSVVSAKVSLLAKWINEAKHVVIHSGAGISTSSGIPDFRGPRGVWTLQSKGLKPDPSADFNEAIPSPTHMAISKLVERRKVKYVVTQNIDGLHLRSNLNRVYLSELHGNMFIEQCNTCNRQFVRSAAVPTVGQKTLGKPCPTVKPNGRACRGRLHDTILDWEHSLPENDLGMADFHSCMADLSICLGTTMQIVPSGNLPLYTKKHGGRLVICNLQPTKHDRKADLLIHAYVDEVMIQLMKHLNLKIPKYSVRNDPTKTLAANGAFLEWTISDEAINKMRKIYEEKCGSKEAKKRLEMIDDEDDLPLITKVTRKGRGSSKDDDPDLEVVNVIVKPKKGATSAKETPKRGPKRSAPEPPTLPYNTTITVKKITPPAKKAKAMEKPEKITIKKNVTPTKTKYEIVQPAAKEKPRKAHTKCEIVYSTKEEPYEDLEMICESDDDDMTNNFTTNFKRYLYDDIKKEEKKDIEKGEVEEDKTGKSNVEMIVDNEIKEENQTSLKDETKTEEQNDETRNAEEGSSEATATTDETTEKVEESKAVESPSNMEESSELGGEKESAKASEGVMEVDEPVKEQVDNQPSTECSAEDATSSLVEGSDKNDVGEEGDAVATVPTAPGETKEPSEDVSIPESNGEKGAEENIGKTGSQDESEPQAPENAAEPRQSDANMNTSNEDLNNEGCGEREDIQEEVESNVGESAEKPEEVSPTKQDDLEGEAQSEQDATEPESPPRNTGEEVDTNAGDKMEENADKTGEETGDGEQSALLFSGLEQPSADLSIDQLVRQEESSLPENASETFSQEQFLEKEFPVSTTAAEMDYVDNLQQFLN